MSLRPPRSTRSATLFPYTTRFLSLGLKAGIEVRKHGGNHLRMLAGNRRDDRSRIHPVEDLDAFLRAGRAHPAKHAAGLLLAQRLHDPVFHIGAGSKPQDGLLSGGETEHSQHLYDRILLAIDHPIQPLSPLL